MKKCWKKILIPADKIRRRVARLGREISRDFTGEDLVLVAVLKGSIVFLGDLIRQIELPLSIDFLEVSSYGHNAHTCRAPRLTKDITTDIRGKTVLVVDDILDSGHTLNFVLEHLRARGPRQIKICVLLNKKHRREIKLDADYCGFSIDNHFVAGYGLDYCGGLRHLPFVAVIKP